MVYAINVEDINNNENEHNMNLGMPEGSIFERIYKNMKNNTNLENNDDDNQKYNLDELIEKKDNVIDNQFDMIKNNQKGQIESSMEKTDKKSNIDNNICDNINNNEQEENNINKNLHEELMEEEENNEKITEKNGIINENVNEKEIISNNINDNKENINENNIENSKIEKEEEGEKEKEKEKEVIDSKPKSKKNEVFERLANFLDSTVENPEPLISLNNPQSQINNKIITDINFQENTNLKNQNINTYMATIQNQADNIALNLELKEAKKNIDTMTSIISDLKLELKSKDEYLNKALLSQKNESDLLIQRQNTLMESLM